MKTLSIEVRYAEPKDAAEVSEVHRQSWLQAYAGLIPHTPLHQMVARRDERWWRKATRGPATLLVAEVAGVIAGYATVGLNRARALPQEGEIYELYLRPEYQGIGLGRLLFGEARGLLRVVQDHFGDLAFGLVQVVQAALDLFQQVAHAVHKGS